MLKRALLLLAFALLTSACTNGLDSKEREVMSTPIRLALEKYINDRLWFYPAKFPENASELSAYIDRTIDVEVRLYSKSKAVLYGVINENLYLIKNENGIVYCDGIVKEGNPDYPMETDHYKVVDTITLKIIPAHRPDFGMSQKKSRMMEAAQAKIREFCEDMSNGEDGDAWNDAKIYMADFYEYERGVIFWIVRRDGYAFYYPLSLAEKAGGIEVVSQKGYGVDNINKWDANGFDRYSFDLQTQNAVKTYIWKNNVRSLVAESETDDSIIE